MRRVIGIDVHRTFGEVVIWEDGILRHAGRVDMTRTAVEGLGKSLRPTDEVVIEATANSMAVSRVLTPFVARVIIANPLQVKAIAQAHVKTDRIDAGTLASLQAAGYLPQIWTPDAVTERKRRLAARRYQVVRHRTRIKNEVHSILHAHLIPKCPHADLFSTRGRSWLARQPLPDDERAAVDRHVRELDRLAEDLTVLDREIAQAAIEDPAVRRLITITGVNLTVATGIVAAIGDISRFNSPQKLVSYFGLNPRVRQSGLGAAHYGRISKVGRSHARAMLVEAAWAAARSLEQVQERVKDIQFQSKTRFSAAQIRELEAMRRTLADVLAKLPDNLRDDPQVRKLEEISHRGAVTLIHLVNRHDTKSSDFKDYEFSRATVDDLWQAGQGDAERMLKHPDACRVTELGNDMRILEL